MNKRTAGRMSERIAVNYLKSRGYKILFTNWTCYAGELDIVAFRGRLTFIEVKSAFSGFCSPCELFTQKKRKNILRTINNFLLLNQSQFTDSNSWVLDLICVYRSNYGYEIKHYENVG